MAKETIHFRASCIKTLSAVEARPERSNQHEFNGVKELKSLFGLAGFSKDAVFSIRGEGVSCIANITWYDAREAHPTRSEHRLYFNDNVVMQMAKEGDNIIVGFDSTDNIHIILIKSGLSENESIKGWRVV
ncbi:MULTISPECIES: type II restriction endonuclease [Serratia]|uniref:type II restriction endonuclease n=1 Tax=Serratia TaxID=613 RepID=UPI00146143D0|nr:MULTISPECIES: type II restriction endonuclease [Serratia]MBH3112232.1 type II restriction endonuclease [Serratia marcescens]MBH3187822.1 type II restriction endonuclease [Serratia marcescens]MDQ7099115.1 type II restriction endonuclease [Serratia sp. MF2]MDQ7105621.1 type II restriction endonuclease [Serratia sp. MF1(2023)]NMQ36122.1 type II restriction endonuclease [Serratia marcescens]